MMAMKHTDDCTWRTTYGILHRGDLPMGECECDCHGVTS